MKIDKGGEEIKPFGYELDENYLPVRKHIRFRKGDYGFDPMGNGLFRMVPSGDIVDATERDRRIIDGAA